ncbi:hypothetical protein RchiOBHm_Chr6g0244941 [Rosa chinensis]|uniref:Uncharacterized protein n=1 Tax=Rosa chinensis TaxID=74649 RepID=A0A2P6PJ52_ROSCH|nr:hypothetical protein RchiOBHm_Chr6g0244941 [Rosa chinensis]
MALDEYNQDQNRGRNSGGATEAENDYHPAQEDKTEALGLLRMDARLWVTD